MNDDAAANRPNRAGYFLMPRLWLDDPLVKPKLHEEFSRPLMWCWIVENACYQARYIATEDGRSIYCRRGQLAYSIRFLAKAWRTSKGKVDRQLKQWKKAGYIETYIEAGRTVITICNYDKFQDATQYRRTQKELPKGEARDIRGTNKNENINQDNSITKSMAVSHISEQIYAKLLYKFDVPTIKRYFDDGKCRFAIEEENKIYVLGGFMCDHIGQPPILSPEFNSVF